MKKIIAVVISAMIGISMILDSYWLFLTNKSVHSASATNAVIPVKQKSASSSEAQSTMTNSTQATTSTNGKYKDGTYSGSVVNTNWGNVQVQVTISGSKITNVTMLQSTSSDGETHSQQVDSQAEPIYISETKVAQSAKIQAVSGATVTFEGYTTSLQATLDKAV